MKDTYQTTLNVLCHLIDIDAGPIVKNITDGCHTVNNTQIIFAFGQSLYETTGKTISLIETKTNLLLK